MLIGGHVRSPEDIEFLRNRNFGFGEIVFTGPEPPFALVSNATEYFKDFFLIAHAPKEGSPTDSSNLTNRYIPCLKRTVLNCADQGILLLTVHCWLDQRFIPAEFIEFKLHLLKEITNYAEEHGVVICLENLSERAEDFELIFKSVPNLLMTLDVGHAELLSGRNTSHEIIRHFAPKIRHVHIHDNKGGNSVKDDLHLMPGQGTIRIRSILSELFEKGYDGTFTLEVERDQLLESRAKFLDLIEDMKKPTHLG